MKTHGYVRTTNSKASATEDTEATEKFKDGGLLDLGVLCGKKGFLSNLNS